MTVCCCCSICTFFAHRYCKKIRTRMCAPNWVWNLLAWPTDGGRFIILPIHLFIPFFNYYLTYSIHLLSPFFNFYFSNWIIHTVFQLLFNLLIYSHRFSIIMFLIELLCFLFIYRVNEYRFQLCFFIHFILLFVSYYFFNTNNAAGFSIIIFLK